MKKLYFAAIFAVIVLLFTLTACGEQPVMSTSAPPAQSSGALSATVSVPSAESAPEPTPAPVPTIPEAAPTPEPEKIAPADHVFPDLEIFFSRTADENRSDDARGWKYYFKKLQPYDELETVEAELLALLQEPRFQLELVDKETSVYESGDINPIVSYYFRYTGTAELTEIRDVLGVRLDNVVVTFYHVPIYGYYDVSVWRSPEFEVVDPGCQVSASTDVDPSAKLLPDIFAFLYHSPSTEKRYYSNGLQKYCTGTHPGSAYETVMEELLALLAQDRYQLELVDEWINPHYSGIEMREFFYVYTGAAEGIETLVDEREEHEFHVRLTLTDYPEYDYFKIKIVYSKSFDSEDPGTHTSRDIDHDSDGGVLMEVPDTGSDSGSDFWKKCSACHGSGKCTHCSGKGEVRKFQAGLGWVEQDCTLCNRGKCRHCNGTGKD